jgi:hypothetical protein
MDYNSNLVRLLFYVPTGMEVAIAYLLFHRRFYREVIWFSVYILFQIASSAVMYVLYEHGDPYLYFYSRWIAEGISVTLAFMVILEIFRISVDGYESIRRIGIRLLIGAAVVSVILGLSLMHQGVAARVSMVNFELEIENCLRIIQIGLLLTLFAFTSYLALNWSHYVLGIAVGYGLYAAANLAIHVSVLYVGKAYYYFSLLDAGAFSCTVIIWLAYLWRSKSGTPPDLPPSSRDDLRSWDEALSVLAGQAGGSFSEN